MALFSIPQLLRDADFEMQWVRAESGGNVYLGRFDIDGRVQEMEGWLCPALNLYYPDAPQKLYVQLRKAETTRLSPRSGTNKITGTRPSVCQGSPPPLRPFRFS